MDEYIGHIERGCNFFSNFTFKSSLINFKIEKMSCIAGCQLSAWSCGQKGGVSSSDAGHQLGS